MEKKNKERKIMNGRITVYMYIVLTHDKNLQVKRIK